MNNFYYNLPDFVTSIIIISGFINITIIVYIIVKASNLFCSKTCLELRLSYLKENDFFFPLKTTTFRSIFCTFLLEIRLHLFLNAKKKRGKENKRFAKGKC